MPNIGQILKEEIQRIARKEVKAATAPLQSSNAFLRHSVAELKRRLAEVERQNKQLLSEAKKKSPREKVSEDEVEAARITAKMIKSIRARLGLSQTSLAQLLEVSPISVAKWEKKTGRLSFRSDAKTRIVALRGMRKAEVQRRLAEM